MLVAKVTLMLDGLVFFFSGFSENDRLRGRRWKELLLCLHIDKYSSGHPFIFVLCGYLASLAIGLIHVIGQTYCCGDTLAGTQGLLSMSLIKSSQRGRFTR
ncbi:hypothetical protein K1719_020991 [Acacia pycnantha]|nr:hypothetical protein K1719_020991 [Acacia pycnantha]